jgi:H+-transporting ATPase
MADSDPTKPETAALPVKKESSDDLDEVGPLPPSLRKRVKVMSDLTGIGVSDMVGGGTATHDRRPRRANRKTVSDITIMLSLPPEVIKEQQERRKKVKTSSDVVAKFGYVKNLDGDDLKMAEDVAAYGTTKEREESGMGLDEGEQEAGPEEPPIELNHEGLTTAKAEELLQIHGPNELPEKVTPKWLIFLQQFWAPMPIMIWIAIIIEAAITNFLDMAILLFIQFTNASISFYETTKAGDAVAALKSSLKPTATCKRDGKWIVMDSRLLVPGDTVLLGSGSAIPADCRLNASEIDVDQAALTGESLPVTFFKFDSVKMGSTVVRGEVEATVEFTGANSFFGKTAGLLEDTHELSHLQKILLKIMLILVALSITLCLIYFIYLITQGVDFKEALSITVVILVASIPLAIEIVTTTTLAIGSKKLVHHGAIVAKLSAIEDLAGMSILCSDKTGTLTLNQMMLQEDTPTYRDGTTRESALMYAAIAAKWKEPARDALDRLTLGNVKMELLDSFEQLEYVPFDPQFKRTEGTVKDTRTGETFKTSKGAPHIILGLMGNDPADNVVRDAVERDVARLGEKGIRSLAVARTYQESPGAPEKWTMLALLTFLDPPRPDTKKTIEEANKNGVDVKMITGSYLDVNICTMRLAETQSCCSTLLMVYLYR